MRIDNQLELPQVQQRILHLRRKFENEVCFEIPIIFWKKAKYFIQLPYKEDYKGTPCKRRAIPMNTNYQKLCEEEIKGLMKKV